MKRHLDMRNEIGQSCFGTLATIIVGSAMPRYSDPTMGRR